MIQPLLRRLVFDIPQLAGHTKMPLKVTILSVLSVVHINLNVALLQIV